MNWDDLRFFLAVAGAGSLSGAGQPLGVNTTTVLRRVASLEDDLGARLFERERTGYRLTAAGEKLRVSQSAISRQILLLEEEHGEPVFHRFVDWVGVFDQLGMAVGGRLTVSEHPGHIGQPATEG